MFTKIKSIGSMCMIVITILLTSSGCQNSFDYNKNNANNSNILPENQQTNFVDKLDDEGFIESDIENANIYVKRIVFQLNEINTFRNLGNQSDISNDFFYNNTDDDWSKYSQILAKIDEDKAVYYLVKLKKEFINQDEIFNEYLLSLQLDIDFDMYINDKDLYHDQKLNKLSEIPESSFITVNQIEQKSFENLQRLNDLNKTIQHGGDQNINSNRNIDLNSPQKPNLPQIDIPKPIDPNEELRNKLPNIN